MKKIIIKTQEPHYSKIRNQFHFDVQRTQKSNKFQDKRFKKPRYKKNYLDEN